MGCRKYEDYIIPKFYFTVFKPISFTIVCMIVLKLFWFYGDNKASEYFRGFCFLYFTETFYTLKNILTTPG